MSTPIGSLAVALPAGVSRSFLIRHRICPIGSLDGQRLRIARVADSCAAAIEDLAGYLGLAPVPVDVSTDELDRLIERCVNETERMLAVERLDDPTEDDARTADVRDLASQPPVIRYVNLLLRDAVEASASDIHLESAVDGLDVRFRVDGVLVPAPEPPADLRHAVVSRIKTIADLDIAERRRPQDGRIRIRLADRELDLRVATVPTTHGESVVLRLLDRGARPTQMDVLGLPAGILGTVRELVGRPHGLVLVTGPTGSGKTTTLYAALTARDPRHEKIVTVEDPVEYQLPGITQVPVSAQTGMTFAGALRAILRQDPDVLLIGEMRDRETAEVGVQAALTGHLVLSTLHTNDAVSAIARLLDLGVPEYLVSGTLDGILAQRLVRRLCDACAMEDALDVSIGTQLAGRLVSRARIRRPVGCASCRGTGFRGRTGLYELVRVTDPMRALIARRAPADLLHAQAREDGMRTLREHGWDLVGQGVTSPEEVLRVAQE